MRKGLISAAMLMAIAVPAAAAPRAAAPITVTSRDFGTLPGGRHARLYTIANRQMRVSFSDWGATITAIEVPDRQGHRANVTLGFGTLGDYVAKNGGIHFGATIGRFANRIGGGAFTLDGRSYRFKPNNGPNLLHSGDAGSWDERLWQVKPIANGARLTLVSRDGDQGGFPGALTVTMTFTLDQANRFRIDYAARTTKPTVVNLTNHSYFNLAGAGNGTIDDQRITIAADRYAEADANTLPTGRLLPVAGALDLRHGARIGDGYGDAGVAPFGGYDHPFVLADRPRAAPALAAEVRDPASGRTMTVFTTEPAIQLYTSQGLDGSNRTAEGRPMVRHGAFALEAEHLPDSPHHPNWPTTVLRPGQTYRQTTIWQFGIK